MFPLDLGFAEGRDLRWLVNRYFPSKIGGKPAWLELEDLPPKNSLSCPKCQEPMTFLCQIYAPFEELDTAFHRTLYIFVCRAKSCQKSNSAKNFLVLRSQLPRNNAFYSYESPNMLTNPLPAIMPKKPLCEVCGCFGWAKCSRCLQADYCSSLHQRLAWKFGHKNICGSADTYFKIPNILFPDYEIDTHPADSDDDDDNDEKTEDEDSEAAEKKRLSEYEQLAEEGKMGEFKDMPEAELDKYVSESGMVDDKFFGLFKEAMNKYSDQVLRYQRGGQPLWIADPEQTVKKHLEIPKCEYCGGSRQYEFQITPQMLSYLEDDTLDWGVLVVYSCEKSCTPPAGVGYMKEYIVKQDIIK